MIYEHVDWNTNSVGKEISNGLTEDQFIEKWLRQGQYKQFSEDDRKSLLRNVYQMIKNMEYSRRNIGSYN